MKGCHFSILFVITNSALNRGMNTGLENLAWGLAERGVQIHILSGGSAPNNHSYELPSKVEYHFTDASGENPVNFLPAYQKLLSKHKIDVVVGWIINIALLVSLPESKDIAFLANQGQMAPRSVTLRYLKKLLMGQMSLSASIKTIRAIKKFPSHMASAISISDAVRSSCIHSYGLDSSKCIVIPRGVDTDIFCFYKKDVISGRPNLLYAGNVQPSKGIDELVNALGLIDTPVNLTLCGNAKADYIKTLQEKIDVQGKNHRLIYSGSKSQSELVKYYHSCDLFVFPSHAEGLGKVLIEAMSCGCPVVCSDIEVFKEVVTCDHDAVMAPVKSARGLAEAIARFLDDDLFRQECGNNARNTVTTRFSKEIELNSWMNTFHEVIVSRR